jgi:hypothetical protein
MSLDIYAALANSNVKFISCLREFMQKVEQESGLDPKTIEGVFNNNQIVKGFGLISNSSFLTI